MLWEIFKLACEMPGEQKNASGLIEPDPENGKITLI